MTYSHNGCGTYYRAPLLSCPRHPGVPLEEMAMPKITRFGGPTNFGLNESASGFSDDVDAVRETAAVRASSDPTGEGYDNEGTPVAQSGLVAGGDEVPEKDEPPFNPSELSVADVQALLEECSDEERERVIEAERADKNRKGIVGS